VMAPSPLACRCPGGLPVSIEGSARSPDTSFVVLGRVPPSSSPVFGFLLLGRAVAALDDGEIDVDRLVAVLERGEPDRLPDPPVDLLGDVGVLSEELPGVLLALSELVVVVREPCPRLLHDLGVDADVEERTLLGD